MDMISQQLIKLINSEPNVKLETLSFGFVQDFVLWTVASNVIAEMKEVIRIHSTIMLTSQNGIEHNLCHLAHNLKRTYQSLVNQIGNNVKNDVTF